MKVAVSGFEKTGKTTLFNALTGQNIEMSAAPTPENVIHEGVATVLDERISYLSKLFNPKKTTYATIEYVDLPGLSKSDAKRNQKILDLIREVDLIIDVVRGFDDDATLPPFGDINFVRDIRNFESEIILSDHLLVEKRIERMEQNVKRGLKENMILLELFKRMKDFLENEKPLRSFSFTEDEIKLLLPYKFLSTKPIIHVINHNENEGDERRAYIQKVKDELKDCSVLSLCAKVEKEISELPLEERGDFLKELGIEEPAFEKLVKESYRLLGYISFFTVGEDEVRAWTIKRGMTAKEAGGRIHSDIEKGFIRAEVVSYQDFIANGDFKKVKDKGLLRLEGKTYVVNDGDIMNFRFNV
ncbi:MAG: DUF933 domain-containing protein [bacterium]